MRRRNPARWLCVCVLAFSGSAMGQTITPDDFRGPAIILPQRRVIMPSRLRPVEIRGVRADIAIRNQVATTAIQIDLFNPNPTRIEAKLLMPVPDKAVVRHFTYQGGPELKVDVLPLEEARRIYEGIVSSMRDPALLEFVGYNLMQSSVFPVEPGKVQTVHLTYENLLAVEGERVDYILPRTEALDYTVPWRISVDLQDTRPINTAYSPSHPVNVKRESDGRLKIELSSNAVAQPGAFRLSYLVKSPNKDWTATVFAQPDVKAGGGGYFLLLGALPPLSDKQTNVAKREVILVIDRSGSMAGEKMRQTKAAARQIIAGLEKGESFNIITYSDQVESYVQSPVENTAANVEAAGRYIDDIVARGGTNIHGALLEALRPAPAAGTLPIVLFLTDGLATVGQTSETAIRDVVLKANPHNRRVFAFGVGNDVNSPLLEKLADDTRATATFVLPGEDVEVKVAAVFRKLTGPVLTDIRIEAPGERRLVDLLPGRLPDLFDGDQLIVLGRYRGNEDLAFDVIGTQLGDQRRFAVKFDPSDGRLHHQFVPRLWAGRKIADLIDSVRQLGAAPHQKPNMNDPKTKELVDEIVRLSMEFGILTEYTAFLAREDTKLSDASAIRAGTEAVLQDRAMGERSGMASVSQSLNAVARKAQTAASPTNTYYDAQMKQVEVRSVQQIADQTFYRRGNRWIDSRLASDADAESNAEVITVGSDAYLELARTLARTNQQAALSLDGELLLQVGARTVLVR